MRSCQGDVRYSYAHKFVMCGDVRFSGIPAASWASNVLHVCEPSLENAPSRMPDLLHGIQPPDISAAANPTMLKKLLKTHFKITFSTLPAADFLVHPH